MHSTEQQLNLEVLLQRYPTNPLIRYEYGTAGFRMLADLMPPVAFRVGLFLASLPGSATLGVVITASHNPVKDNGIKLVAASGEMMEGIEEEVTRICNLSGPDLQNWAASLKPSGQRAVLIGRDTRPSGVGLQQALTEGLLGVKAIDCGLVTTPQLHYYVRSFNTIPDCTVCLAEHEYLKALTQGFAKICKENPVKITIDCANGVGSITMKKLVDTGLQGLDVTLVNTGEGILNHECGADFVKLYQKAPQNIAPENNVHFASFDGDADRVVFFHFVNGQFHLLDGDRIAVLLAETFKMLLEEAGLKARIGVVQTAYANGASTRHLKNSGLETRMTCTGVKNLHHEAKHFDVGIYFEANGHGTVLFSPLFKETIIKTKGTAKIQALMALVNECVGDAISDLLLVEAVLAMRKLTLADWEAAYHELPSVQLKVPVSNRSMFVTTDADQVLLEPKGLQDQINALITRVSQGRAFVRPSGTEDIVRIYAEAATKEAAERVANKTLDLIKRL